jgi:hypothetical protein
MCLDFAGHSTVAMAAGNGLRRAVGHQLGRTRYRERSCLGHPRRYQRRRRDDYGLLMTTTQHANAAVPQRRLLTLAHKQALRSPPDQAQLVIQRRLRQTSAMAGQMGASVQADPLAHRAAQQVDAEVGVHEDVGG